MKHQQPQAKTHRRTASGTVHVTTDTGILQIIDIRAHLALLFRNGSKLLNSKQHHRKVLLSSSHLNGHTSGCHP